MDLEEFNIWSTVEIGGKCRGIVSYTKITLRGIGCREMMRKLVGIVGILKNLPKLYSPIYAVLLMVSRGLDWMSHNGRVALQVKLWHSIRVVMHPPSPHLPPTRLGQKFSIHLY